MSDIYGFKVIPEELYDTCSKEECIRKNINLANVTFGKKNMETIRDKRKLMFFKKFYTQTGLSRLSHGDQAVDSINNLYNIDVNNYELNSHVDSDLNSSPQSTRYFKALILSDPEAKKLFNLK